MGEATCAFLGQKATPRDEHTSRAATLKLQVLCAHRGMIEVIAKLQAAARKAQADAAALEAGGAAAGGGDVSAEAEDAEAEAEVEMEAVIADAAGGPAPAGGSLKKRLLR